MTDRLASLDRGISPPRKTSRATQKRPRTESDDGDDKQQSVVTSAAVEAGETVVKDNVKFWLSHLEKSCLSASSLARLHRVEDLYRRNCTSSGHHFVVTQHDHPVSGTHYDLRLQINEISSCSWAIMYGLPGNPNSKRLTRNATETRVHCLWNHLIETASTHTGSMMIWDTGEYEILDWTADPTDTADEAEEQDKTALTQPARLHEAFRRGKVKLRFHGMKLPTNYTVKLVLSPQGKLKVQSTTGPTKKRRKKIIKQQMTDSEGEQDDEDDEGHDHDKASDVEDPTDQIRRNNAYTGAENTIGSIHQRTWYLSLDRRASGFSARRDKDGRKHWFMETGSESQVVSQEQGPQGFEAFFIQGVNHEKSIVTDRLADQLLADEGVKTARRRHGWRPVLY